MIHLQFLIAESTVFLDVFFWIGVVTLVVMAVSLLWKNTSHSQPLNIVPKSITPITLEALQDEISEIYKDLKLVEDGTELESFLLAKLDSERYIRFSATAWAKQLEHLKEGVAISGFNMKQRPTLEAFMQKKIEKLTRMKYGEAIDS